jgi:predicted dehydrogenase/RimJ/RimL family protein N-acetyltransferase
VVGQGSIGRRHAAILLELGHEVTVYDPSPGVPAPAGAQMASGTEECLRAADAAVIASPSSNHPADARSAIERGVPVLVEKPLALDACAAAEVAALARARGVMLSVAMSLREHAGVRALSELVAEGALGRVLRASAWCGSWLPGWRPASDYRTSYSARAELGGGVLLDVAVHELDYMLWLLGPARSVSALTSRVSELEVDVEDVALIALELDCGAVAQVAVDYFDRSYTRGCRIVGARGTVHWSWEQEQLTRVDSAGERTQIAVPSDVEPAYRRQLEHFLAAVATDAPAPVAPAEATAVLAVLDAARVSGREGQRVRVPAAVVLREALREDSARVLAWRNDPDTRRWSRTSGEVPADEHASWFERTLRDPSTQIWIAESAGESIGQVRLTEESHGSVELHVTLAPQARGRGLGAAALIEAAAEGLARPGVELVCAHVKPQHEASLRAFARAGFTLAGSGAGGLVRLERRPISRALAAADAHSPS